MRFSLLLARCPPCLTYSTIQFPRCILTISNQFLSCPDGYKQWKVQIISVQFEHGLDGFKIVRMVLILSGQLQYWQRLRSPPPKQAMVIRNAPFTADFLPETFIYELSFWTNSNYSKIAFFVNFSVFPLLIFLTQLPRPHSG